MPVMADVSSDAVFGGGGIAKTTLAKKRFLPIL
jgi:hypothetical protein